MPMAQTSHSNVMTVCLEDRNYTMLSAQSKGEEEGMNDENEEGIVYPRTTLHPSAVHLMFGKNFGHRISLQNLVVELVLGYFGIFLETFRRHDIWAKT